MFTLATKFAPNRVAFQTALIAGFGAAEFWLDANLLSKSDEIATLARDFPFRYALHFPNSGPISVENLNSSVDLYRQLQCTAMIIHQPMFNRYGSALRETLPAIDLAIENHILDQVAFDRWAEESPGLTLDVEHLWKFTLDDAPLSTLLKHVEHVLKSYSKKLHHVHLPGYVPGGEEHHPIHYSSEMATEVLTMLMEFGYQNLVVSEADNEFQTEEILRQDSEWFKQWEKSHQGTS